MFTFPLGFFQKLLQQIISGGDQYFYSIKLLLHGNNSNNSTVITDSSYSGLTATKTGNPIISTTQSKFDGSSIYFGGSSALIYKSTAFNVGSKDCTIELFFNPSVINPDLSVLFEMRPDNTNGAYVQLNFNSTAFTIYFNTVAAITAPVSIAVNTWYYVAVKKVGNLTQLWFQGSKVGEFTSGDWSSSGRIKLGENAFYYPGSNFNGYIDDFRFTLGVARDVSVVSTTPFSDTGTTPAPTDPYFNNVPLLLHGNNSDNSTVITNSGSSSYSVSISNPNNLVVNSSTTGQFNNSLFFSSSGTSLNCVSPSFNVGSQDCTIELFLNVTTTILIWDMRPNNGNGAYPALYLLSGRLTLYFNSSDAIVSTLYITPNVWYYIAVKKIGTVTQLWVDGVKLGEFTSGDWASSERIKLGENSSVAGGTNLNGYIDDFRFTLGVARDVSIIPTVPFPDAAVSTPTDPYFANVVSLLHLNGSNGSTTFTDVKGHNFTGNGNANISTIQSKFAGASLLLDGSGDYLETPIDSALSLAGSDFTLEAWVYLLATTDMMIISSTPAIQSAGYSMMIQGGKLRFESGGGNPAFTSTLSVSSNAWQHVAISKANNNYYLAVNGIVETINNTSVWSEGSILRVGANARLDYPYYFNGYIDDVRITKDIARYTANFTPSTSQFPDAGTSGTTPTAQKLIGTPFGTAPYQFGSEFDKAFDGNTTTYFNSSISSGGYCGIDLGVANTNKITKVRIYPLSGFEGRSSGAIIQGSNTIDSGYVDLFTFGTTTSANTWYEGIITTLTAYRYLRYFGASGQSCTIAEVEFYAAVSTTTNVSLTYSSNGDTNGLFYYLGTNKNTVAWSNPSGNKITIAASSVSLGSVELLTDRNPSEFYTSSTANSWVEFNISPSKLMCSGYSLRNRSSADHYLRNWQLQGSIDNGVTWSILDNQVNNTTLNTPSQWLYLPVTSSVAYSKFRIYETGLNSSNAYYICLGEVELYGSVPAPTTTPTPKLTTDPYLSNVILYLKGDGVDSSTNIIDSSPLVKSITLFGNAKISTTQFKTGSSSIYFDGNGDYLSFDGNLSSQQLTIETYIYPTSQLPEIFSTADASNNIQNNNLLLGAYSGNWGLSKWGSGLPINYGNNLFVLNNWNHVAFTRDANNICRLFINGIKQGVDIAIVDTFNSPKILIGYNASYQYPTFFQGYLDSYRITANVARYTANFNPLTDTYLDS